MAKIDKVARAILDLAKAAGKSEDEIKGMLGLAQKVAPQAKQTAGQAIQKGIEGIKGKVNVPVAPKKPGKVKTPSTGATKPASAPAPAQKKQPIAEWIQKQMDEIDPETGEAMSKGSKLADGRRIPFSMEGLEGATPMPQGTGGIGKRLEGAIRRQATEKDVRGAATLAAGTRWTPGGEGRSIYPHITKALRDTKDPRALARVFNKSSPKTQQFILNELTPRLRDVYQKFTAAGVPVAGYDQLLKALGNMFGVAATAGVATAALRNKKQSQA